MQAQARSGQRRKASGIHKEGLAEGLESCCFFLLQPRLSFFKELDRLDGMQAFPAVRADVGGHANGGHIIAAPQKFLDSLFNKLTTANGTPVKRLHSPVTRVFHVSGWRLW